MSAAPTCASVALATLAACSRPPVHTPSEERLENIKFEGNRNLTDGELVEGLALHRAQKRGTPPDPYVIQVDADRIRGQYLRLGYLDVDVRSRVEREGNATEVIYTIEEGVRALTRVVITGLPEHDPDLPVSKVRKTLPLDDGAPFDYEVYAQAKDQLRGVVEDAGYAHVTLEPLVVADRANHTAIVQLPFAPGPKSTFGSIEVVGVQGDLRDAALARLQFRPGQQYSTVPIAATQRAIYGLNRFSMVRVLPDKSNAENPVVAIKIDAAESSGHELRIGGGFGIDPEAYELRGRLGYTVAGWPFPLDTASLDLRPGYARLRDTGNMEPRARALAKLERQDIFGTYTRGEAEAGYSYLAVEAYTSYGPRARLGFSTPLGTDRLLLQLGWTIERFDFRAISTLIDDPLKIALGLDHPQRIGAFDQSLVVDLRDHPIEPRLGGYAELRASEGSRYLGGSLDYLELVPDVRGYVPIGPVVLAARARTGAIFGDIPVTERFFSGGATSQRGYPERRLAPSARGTIDGEVQSVPYGGGGLIESNLEARLWITTIKKMRLGVVAFLDGADVTETPGQLDPFDLHWAAGGGVRLLTLVGPVRFDVGYRLNRKGPLEPDPGSTIAYHLSIGEAF